MIAGKDGVQRFQIVELCQSQLLHCEVPVGPNVRRSTRRSREEGQAVRVRGAGALVQGGARLAGCAEVRALAWRGTGPIPPLRLVGRGTRRNNLWFEALRDGRAKSEELSQGRAIWFEALNG